MIKFKTETNAFGNDLKMTLLDFPTKEGEIKMGGREGNRERKR